MKVKNEQPQLQSAVCWGGNMALVTVEGELYVKGNNKYGSLGVGHVHIQETFVKIIGLPPVSAVDVGEDLMLVRTKEPDGTHSIYRSGRRSASSLSHDKLEVYFEFKKIPIEEYAQYPTQFAVNNITEREGMRCFSTGKVNVLQSMADNRIWLESSDDSYSPIAIDLTDTTSHQVMSEKHQGIFCFLLRHFNTVSPDFLKMPTLIHITPKWGHTSFILFLKALLESPTKE
ncbi:MAG: hypothetical protein KDH94_08640, partial [Coxiellaceae bacterium]|nr:hypothetical protein [Coxiellaceae bacterium]